MRGMATLPQGNQEQLVIRDKVGRPPGELGVIKSMKCHIFPSVFQHCWLGDRKGIRPVKNRVLACWWWWFDWSTISIILCFNKHWLWPLKGERLELRMMEVVVTTGAIRRAKLQSNCHHQQTDTQFLQAGCPYCRPTVSVKALLS